MKGEQTATERILKWSR